MKVTKNDNIKNALVDTLFYSESELEKMYNEKKTFTLFDKIGMNDKDEKGNERYRVVLTGREIKIVRKEGVFANVVVLEDGTEIAIRIN